MTLIRKGPSGPEVEVGGGGASVFGALFVQAAYVLDDSSINITQSPAASELTPTGISLLAGAVGMVEPSNGRLANDSGATISGVARAIVSIQAQADTRIRMFLAKNGVAIPGAVADCSIYLTDDGITPVPLRLMRGSTVMAIEAPYAVELNNGDYISILQQSNVDPLLGTSEEYHIMSALIAFSGNPI